jgi:hypothetical protein
MFVTRIKNKFEKASPTPKFGGGSVAEKEEK